MCNRVARKSVLYTVLRPDSPKIRMMTDIVITDMNMPLAVKLRACTLVKYVLDIT